MKIKFVSQYFYPDPFSNTNIVRKLKERGHDITVLTAVPNYSTGAFAEGFSNTKRSREVWNGIDVERVFTVPRGKSKLQLIINYFMFPLVAGTKMMFRKKEGHELVFVSLLSPVYMAIPAIIYSRRHKLPLVYWVQDLWPESPIYLENIQNPLVIRFLKKSCEWIFGKADFVFVQSEAFFDPVERLGVDRDRQAFFPNTALELYRPYSQEEAKDYEHWFPKEGFNILFAGNIGESQDFDSIVETADILRDRCRVNWIIVGSGRDKNRIEREIEKRNLSDHFVFLGRHPEETMPYFFAHADALLVTLRDFPIFGLTVPYKVQSYMACGKPIIGNLSGEGARIIQTAGAGVTADAGKPEMLAEEIEKLVNLPLEQRQGMGKNALKYFKNNYDSMMVFDRLSAMLKKIGKPEQLS